MELLLFQERSSQAKTWGKKGRKEGKKEEERQGKKGRENERKVNVSTDVVNYPIKQFSLNSKNRNRKEKKKQKFIKPYTHCL